MVVTRANPVTREVVWPLAIKTIHREIATQVCDSSRAEKPLRVATFPDKEELLYSCCSISPIELYLISSVNADIPIIAKIANSGPMKE